MLKGLRVLVVDDSDNNRRVLESQLASWGVRPVVAEHRRTVVATMRSTVAAVDPYVLAVLDICMPDLDALERASLISADTTLTDTRLILLSPEMSVDSEAMERAGRQRGHRPPAPLHPANAGS